MDKWFQLFWLFIKINLLTTSGPASAGLLYKEAVGRLMTEEEFIEAVGFSSVMPGSDALQLAMFVGYAVGGMPGALVALLGSILPPTVLMLLIVSLLQRIRGEAWISNFVQGLSPAVAVLMLLVAWKIFGEDARNWKAVIIAVVSFIAFQLKVPPVPVLLAAGLVGIWLFR